MVYPEYVIKRDGNLAKFKPERIKYAIKRAMLAVNKYDEKKLDKILEYVLKVIEEKYDGKQNPKVEEIQDIVELALMKFDEYEVAKAYITYRKEKEKIRREKIAILGEFYDEKVAKKFSLNSIRLMANRYLLKNEDGSLKEGPKQMFERVAMLVVIPDILYDSRIFDKEGKQNVWEIEKFDAERYENKIGLGKIEEDKYKVYWNRYHLKRMKALYDELNKQGKMRMPWREFFKKLERGEFDEYYEKFLEYFELMVSKKFMPNSPTLFNAGARLGQLSACFVLDIEDDMASIMETAKEAAIIFKSGGGIGINYSKLRPEGDIVASTTGVASGPVSFMKIIDTVTDVVKQGGCVSADSFIFTDSGILKPYHLRIPNPKDDFPLHVNVYDGNNFVNAFIGSFGNKQEVLKFITKEGYELEVTYNELVATVDEKGDIIFKPAYQLNKDDYLVLSLGKYKGKKIKLPKIDKSHFNSNNVRVPEYLDEDLAEILGYYMADGSWNNGRLIMSFNSKETLNYIKKKIKKSLNLEPGEIRDKKTWIDVVWFSKDLEKYFEKRGWKKESSPNAFIPMDILNSEENVLAAFLRGLFEGDGSVHKSGYPMLYSTSEKLIKEVQIALLSLGIISKITTISKEKLGNEHKGWRDVYQLRIVDKKSIERFVSKIGFISKEKNDKTKNSLNKRFEYTRIIPNQESKLKRVLEMIREKDKNRAEIFYRKVHKYILGYRNLTYNSLKNLEKEFPEIKKVFSNDIHEKYAFLKIDRIERTKREVFHFETTSGKYVINGFLIHNKRRGANMGILEVWHPDIEKFIHAKETEGILENFNISVMITPEFWEYYEKDEDFPLVNPRNGKVWSTINPRKFFSELAYIAWKSADPGVLFMDNINKRNVMKHSKGMIRSTNPCVTGDTLILTDSGLIKAEELKPGMFVWTPKGWNEIEEVYNNGVKDVYEVELVNGLKIKVTKEHKFLTKEGWKKIEDIKEGEEIRIVLESPEDYIKANSINEQFAEFMGYWVGDGSLSLSNHVRLHVGNDEYLAKYFNSVLSDSSGHSFIVNDRNQFIVDTHRKEFANRLREIFGINVSRSYEKDIPDIILKSNKKTQTAFLRGLFSADGSVYDANGSVTISLSSTSKELLEKVQILLLSLGIFSTLTDEKEGEEKTIKEGTYRTRKTYRILINGTDAYKFANEIGLLGTKNNKLKQLLKNHSFYKKEKKFVKIKSIKHVGKDIVYDIKATPTYTWTTNGIYSYDCGEEPLYPYESCNLGSINLYAFIKEDEQHNRYFDWKDFERTIRIAYRFLDNVIDVNKYPLEKIEKQTKAHRKIGLGLMGLADMFFALKIPYNSEEGFELMKKVAEFLTYHAMDESVNRAIERGVFPDYELSGYKNGEMPLEGFYHKEEWNLDWEKLKNRIVKNGIRNLEVTTIAPTGSISMLSDTSSGIEPQFALVFEKRVVAGEYYYVDEELKRQLIENGLWNEEILKKISDNGGSLQGIKEIPEELRKVFVTAMDIPWWDHVRAQAVLQLWITTSISKTINMPSWVEPEDVEKAYLFAYKTGCKGITIYRDGSKSKQVIYIPGEKQKSRIFEVMELVKNKTLAIMDAMGIKPPRWLFQEVKEKSDEIREQEALPKLNLKITMNKIENEAKNIGKEKCPVCGNDKLIYQSGCVTCPQCGWSECVIA